MDKIAHDAEAAQAGDLDREKRIPAEWLTTPGVELCVLQHVHELPCARYDALAGKYRYLKKLAHNARKKMFLRHFV